MHHDQSYRCPYCANRYFHSDRTLRLDWCPYVREGGKTSVLPKESRSISGKVGGVIAGGLMGGPIGAIAGLFLGDTLDD